MPKISIVIPIYNGEKYLERCLNSVINQTFKNIEIVLIDDGSTDNTWSICVKYANIHNNIKLIKTKNSGVSHARNIGIDVSSGQYIEFLDSDDWLETNAIENILENIDEATDIALFGMYFKSFKGSNIIEIEEKAIEKKIEFCNMEIKDHYWDLFVHNYLSSSCNKIFRLQIIKENGIKFEPGLTIYEDLIFSLNVLEFCNDIIAIPDCYYNYYLDIEQTAIQKRFSKNIYQDIDYVCAYINKYIDRIGVTTKQDLDKIKEFSFFLMLSSIDAVFMDGTTKSFGERLTIVSEILKLDSLRCVLNINTNDTISRKLIKFLIYHKYIWGSYVVLKLRYVKNHKGVIKSAQN